MKIRSILIQPIFSFALMLMLSLVVSVPSSIAQQDLLFTEFNAESRAKLDYGPMDDLLYLLVWDVGRSDRKYSRPPRPKLGSRVNYYNTEPSRLEGNRVFYHTVEPEHVAWIKDYRAGLEAIPDQYSLSRLNRDEQLAYWLNLYTVTVIEHIAEAYPKTDLRDLRDGSDSFFFRKTLRVEGVDLSLRDIETRIMPNFGNPLVIYGLFQGSIGGPNVRTKAYTGSTVYDQLKDNAEDFINSLRGIQFRGDLAKVSEFYQWQAHFFPNFESDVRNHMMDYANPDVLLEIRATNRLEASVYDWHIADLYNGYLAAGASSDNPAEFVMGQMQTSSAGEGGVGVMPNGFSISGNLAENTASASDRFPPHVQEFVVGVYNRFLENYRGRVDVEERNDGTEVVVTPDDDEGNN